jgi:prepilin-type N-terminal cleavage/methylation domain-containing protein
MKIFNKAKKNKGMTYIELIVVLSIFAVISSVVIFNYGTFQAKIDIKNLASDIALQIVQAQKSALSGLQTTLIPSVFPWKPSYGVYFDSTTPKQFIYFADLNNQNGYEAGEALSTIAITKNNSISKLEVIGPSCPVVTNLGITFKRPDSSAMITSNNLAIPCTISYVQITISSLGGKATSIIKLYPSGRVQIN